MDRTSALFLDRDGVINHRKIGGYITCYDNFVFIEGVLEALQIFNKYFSHIFIVTNQQGIGKGLMSEEDFERLNILMLNKISLSGGRIDRVYHCSALKQSNDPRRKPQIGMLLQAQNDYPTICLDNSIMVGDSMTDMLFGKNGSLQTIFIDNKTESDIDEQYIDKRFNSLIEYARWLENNNKAQ